MSVEDAEKRPHVVIVGAGVGGVATVSLLGLLHSQTFDA